MEGPSRTDAAVLRGRTRGNKTALFEGEAAAGDLVPIAIERATSQTLAGRVAVTAGPDPMTRVIAVFGPTASGKPRRR